MNKLLKNIPSDKGVYILFLRCVKAEDVRVGSFGSMKTKEGYYAYIGSAYGGGGLKSRLSRHLKTAKKCRWHIDYIRRHMKAEAIWYTTESKDAEHVIASVFIDKGIEVPMNGFGSSDCKCLSHLFYLTEITEELFHSVSKKTNIISP